MRYRGGKYGAVVSGYVVNSNDVAVYRRELDCWDTFVDSCKDLAEKVKTMLDKEAEPEQHSPNGKTPRARAQELLKKSMKQKNRDGSQT